jgi:hypothetical protein
LAYYCPHEDCKYHLQRHFNRLQGVRDHYRRAHTERTLACPHPQCSKRFSMRKDLDTHKKSCQRVPLVCKCGANLSSLPALKSHIKRFAVGHQARAHGVSTFSVAVHQIPSPQIPPPPTQPCLEVVVDDVTDAAVIMGNVATDAVAQMQEARAKTHAHHAQILTEQIYQSHAHMQAMAVQRMHTMEGQEGGQTRCKKCLRPKAPSNYGFCTLHRDPLSTKKAKKPRVVPARPSQGGGTQEEAGSGRWAAGSNVVIPLGHEASARKFMQAHQIQDETRHMPRVVPPQPTPNPLVPMQPSQEQGPPCSVQSYPTVSYPQVHLMAEV